MVKELRVRSAQLAPIAKLAAVTAEVVAPPGDQWLRSVCKPWRLALGTLRHTRYKSKALVHTLPIYPLNAATGARTQVAGIRADSHNQPDVADLLKRFLVDLRMIDGRDQFCKRYHVADGKCTWTFFAGHCDGSQICRWVRQRKPWSRMHQSTPSQDRTGDLQRVRLTS